MRITAGTKFPINPEDIRTHRQFFGAFGKMEKEELARWIVKLCQTRGGWLPFTLKELRSFMGDEWDRIRKIAGGKVSFEAKYLEKDEHGNLYVTSWFVERCFDASPMHGD